MQNPHLSDLGIIRNPHIFKPDRPNNVSGHVFTLEGHKEGQSTQMGVISPLLIKAPEDLEYYAQHFLKGLSLNRMSEARKFLSEIPNPTILLNTLKITGNTRLTKGQLLQIIQENFPWLLNVEYSNGYIPLLTFKTLLPLAGIIDQTYIPDISQPRFIIYIGTIPLIKPSITFEKEIKEEQQPLRRLSTLMIPIEHQYKFYTEAFEVINLSFPRLHLTLNEGAVNIAPEEGLTDKDLAKPDPEGIKKFKEQKGEYAAQVADTVTKSNCLELIYDCDLFSVLSKEETEQYLNVCKMFETNNNEQEISEIKNQIIEILNIAVDRIVSREEAYSMEQLKELGRPKITKSQLLDMLFNPIARSTIDRKNDVQDIFTELIKKYKDKYESKGLEIPRLNIISIAGGSMRAVMDAIKATDPEGKFVRLILIDIDKASETNARIKASNYEDELGVDKGAFTNRIHYITGGGLGDALYLEEALKAKLFVIGRVDELKNELSITDPALTDLIEIYLEQLYLEHYINQEEVIEMYGKNIILYKKRLNELKRAIAAQSSNDAFQAIKTAIDLKLVNLNLKDQAEDELKAFTSETVYTEFVGLTDYLPEDIIKKIYNSISNISDVKVDANIQNYPDLASLKIKYPNLENIPQEELMLFLSRIYLQAFGWPYMYNQNPENWRKLSEDSGFKVERTDLLENYIVQISTTK